MKVKKFLPSRSRKNIIKRKQIPSGVYCYDLNGICPHWEHTRKGARCKLLKLNSKKHDPSNLIWDQCKECNINNDV